MRYLVLALKGIVYGVTNLLPGIGGGLILALGVLAWPWLFSIRTRPLLPRADSVVGGVLSEPRRTRALAHSPSLHEALLSV